MNTQRQQESTTIKPSFTPAPIGLVQRKCACGNHTPAGGECEECSKNKQTLQRASLAPHERGIEGEGEAPPIVHEVLRSPGQTLDPATRAFFEPRFGNDFSQVRVHTDAKAAESARTVNALAYTVGRDVVFGAGQYAPRTNVGRTLVAHELAHVLQQGESSSESFVGIRISSSADTWERNAETLTQAAMEGGGHQVMRTDAGACLQRQRNPTAARAKPRPKIDYKNAEKANKRFAAPNVLGWATKLETVAGGDFKAWADLWNAADYNGFADKVAEFQREQGFTGKSVDGILGLQSWARIGGIGEAMAGIESVVGERCEEVCTLATKERIERGRKLATGKTFSLPKDKDANTFNIILQTIEGRMLDMDQQYRGAGAAGAIVYAGLGTFVPETDIWNGGLRPGAALQVWRHQDAYKLLQAGEIEEKGKKRRINSGDANFFGTSAVFVRYDTENPEKMLVRHFGESEWWKKSDWAVWLAANVTASGKAKEIGNE